ncbi:MAG: 5-formyltetrahydrofolate cyclo-ligase, partial [Thaumarchaeota archaeon]|nr:5-formyltetrahydrofolate cyclo-ligase [Nitrososphaerota archaeon]
VEWLPRDAYDLTVNIIATPTKIMKVEGGAERPSGVIWSLLAEEKIREIPILRKLKSRYGHV